MYITLEVRTLIHIPQGRKLHWLAAFAGKVINTFDYTGYIVNQKCKYELCVWGKNKTKYHYSLGPTKDYGLNVSSIGCLHCTIFF